MTRAGTRAGPPVEPDAAVVANVEAIRAWQAHLRSRLLPSERLANWVARTAGQSAVIGAHVLWFGAWIGLNSGWLGFTPFDPYPYLLLTLVVSLEAIFLSLFVLASQNRMAALVDKRSHLDLQIDLLAEREMTAVLQMLCAIAHRLKVPATLSRQQLDEFTRPTDLATLAAHLEALDTD